MSRRWLPAVLWSALLAGVLLLMAAAGDGALAAPPWRRPEHWSAWATERGGAAAALAIVRVTVMGVAAWLLSVTAVSLVVALGRPVTAVELADLLGSPLVARVVQATLGVGLAGATVAAAAGLSGPIVPDGRAPAATAGPPTLEALGPSVGVPTTSTTSSTTTTLATTTTLPTTPTTVPAPEPSTPTTVPAPAPTTTTKVPTVTVPPSPTTWVVQPGDHLWSIAEQVVGGADGAPGTSEVARYWRALVEANRDRLADPGNPDLLFAGQELSLPTSDGRAVPSRR